VKTIEANKITAIVKILITKISRLFPLFIKDEITNMILCSNSNANSILVPIESYKSVLKDIKVKKYITRIPNPIPLIHLYLVSRKFTNTILCGFKQTLEPIAAIPPE
jgi:hypothetical protein